MMCMHENCKFVCSVGRLSMSQDLLISLPVDRAHSQNKHRHIDRITTRWGKGFVSTSAVVLIIDSKNTWTNTLPKLTYHQTNHAHHESTHRTHTHTHTRVEVKISWSWSGVKFWSDFLGEILGSLLRVSSGSQSYYSESWSGSQGLYSQFWSGSWSHYTKSLCGSQSYDWISI